MSNKEEEQSFTIHGSVFRDKPATVKATRMLHRILPISAQRAFRDGAFRGVADSGAAITAGFSAIFRPRLAARFLALGRRREDHRYGLHPRQVIEVVHPARGVGDPRRRAGEKPKLVIFVHGGAWGSGATWMYRLVVDRLTSSDDPQLGSCTVASLGYRVHPDADTAGQVDDVAEAMRWISGNIGTIGLDSEPEVYVVGHSSGAHIALLYLVQQAEKEGEAAPNTDGEPDSTAGSTEMAGGVATGDGGGYGRRDGYGDGDGGRQLKVEGFIGLGGVYDVHRHYLYESWRGVQEISPMKASHGGLLHTLFDFSHPHLLGRKPHRSKHWPGTPLTPSHPPLNQQHQHQHRKSSSGDEPSPTLSLKHGAPATVSISNSTKGTVDNESLPPGSDRDHYGAAPAAAAAEGVCRARALGKRLPRSLLVHGMADATVPFSQTAAAAAALRALGVPTVVRFVPGGDHFGMVGQLMFSKNSVVEAAMSQFTSQQAKNDARKARADGTALRSEAPQSRL